VVAAGWVTWFTETDVLPTAEPEVAVTVADPWARAVPDPAETDRTEGAELVQVAVEVTSWVDPSLIEACAVKVTESPTLAVAWDADTVSDVAVAGVIGVVGATGWLTGGVTGEVAGWACVCPKAPMSCPTVVASDWSW
jgi:hypothetical protein